MNRKGVAIDDIGPLVFVMVVTVLSVVLLFGNSKLHEINNEKAAHDIELSHKARSAVHNYLESSIEFNGQKMKVVDFVKASKDADPSERIQLFQNHAKQIFEPLLAGNCWQLILKDGESTGAIAAGIFNTLRGKVYIASGQLQCSDAAVLMEYKVYLPQKERTVAVVLLIQGGGKTA